MTNLKDKFISGVTWVAVGRFSSLAIQFIVTIIIARILTPADYGTIGLLTVFVALGGIILDSGFSEALIQKKNTTEVDFSSVFFFNLIIGIILYSSLYFLSPYIAKFYNIPDLILYARILFLIIPINSLGIIQNVIIQKQLEFKKIALANIYSALISGVVGVYAAYANYGIMALVLQQMTMYLCRTIFLICLKRWIPLFKVSYHSIKDMASFSINLLLTSAITVIFANIYTIVIGRFFSPKEVGYYNQAQRFQGITATTITDIILQVSFPLFVNYSSDINLLKYVYREVQLMTVYIVCPLMCLLICIGEPLFYVVLTDKWLPAVPYFKLLCVFGMTLPLHRINTNIFKIFKRGRMILNIEMLRRVIIVISIFLTINHGIYTMLLGQIVSMGLIVAINMYFSGNLINYKLLEQIKDVMPCYLIAAFSALMTYYLIVFIKQPILDIFVKSLFFGGAYFGLSFMFNSKSFFAMNKLIKRYVLKRLIKYK